MPLIDNVDESSGHAKDDYSNNSQSKWESYDDSLTAGNNTGTEASDMSLVMLPGGTAGYAANSNNNSAELEDSQQHLQIKKRRRTTIRKSQLQYLEEVFRTQKYIDVTKRKEISQVINLSEKSVSIWFRNRRKLSKIKHMSMDTCNPCDKLCYSSPNLCDTKSVDIRNDLFTIDEINKGNISHNNNNNNNSNNNNSNTFCDSDKPYQPSNNVTEYDSANFMSLQQPAPLNLQSISRCMDAANTNNQNVYRFDYVCYDPNCTKLVKMANNSDDKEAMLNYGHVVSNKNTVNSNVMYSLTSGGGNSCQDCIDECCYSGGVFYKNECIGSENNMYTNRSVDQEYYNHGGSNQMDVSSSQPYHHQQSLTVQQAAQARLSNCAKGDKVMSYCDLMGLKRPNPNDPKTAAMLEYFYTCQMQAQLQAQSLSMQQQQQQPQFKSQNVIYNMNNNEASQANSGGPPHHQLNNFGYTASVDEAGNNFYDKTYHKGYWFGNDPSKNLAKSLDDLRVNKNVPSWKYDSNDKSGSCFKYQ